MNDMTMSINPVTGEPCPLPEPFARTSLDEYRRLVATTQGDHKVFDNVELDQDQMAVVLQIHDFGIDRMTEDEKHLLYSVIAALKNRIHP